MSESKRRDLGLDILKGVGCALMVIAHSKLKMQGYESYIFWGNLAPAFFFSTAGVTAAFQARKSLREMLFLYGIVFLLGFGYSGFIDPGFLKKFQFEIVQTIALGVLAVYFLEKYFQPNEWAYLLLGVSAFGLDKLMRPLGWQSLEGVLISPGIFPLIPWLSLFFFGVFAYRVKNLYNIVLFILLCVLYYFMFGFVTPDVAESKWRFLFDFFIASSAVVFLAFFVIRAFLFARRTPWNWLFLFLGTNSLLFLFIHYGFVKLCRLFELQRNIELIWNHPWLFWVLILISTTLTMLGIIQFSRWFESMFRHVGVWVALVGLVFVIPFLPVGETYISYLELGAGIIFSLYYHKLGTILKGDDR